LEVVGEDKLPYDINFNNGDYTVKFLLAYSGKYNVDIFLNGVLYSGNIILDVLPQKCPDSAPFMCPDKKCVNSTYLCSNDKDIFKCTDQTKPFFCISQGKESCVSKTSECDCHAGFEKCKGMCLPAGQPNICNNPIVSNCQRKLPFAKKSDFMFRWVM
jgi:hypothetical protein